MIDLYFFIYLNYLFCFLLFFEFAKMKGNQMDI